MVTRHRPRHPLCRTCRVQLVSLCRFVGIQPFGTDAFLRSRLRRHLMEIKVGRGLMAGFGSGAAAGMAEAHGTVALGQVK